MLNKNTGKLGEDMACEYLSSKGIRILRRNFKSVYGEIDIIAQDDTDIIFVEVKTRKNNRCGIPAESVDKKKQTKIKNTSLEFINQNDLARANFRFDVIEIILSSKPTINHIENAFEF